MQDKKAFQLHRTFAWEFAVSHAFLLCSLVLRAGIWMVAERTLPIFFTLNLPPLLMYLLYDRGEAPTGTFLLIEAMEQDRGMVCGL